MRFCKEYGIVISETIAKMSPGLCKPQDDQDCSAVGGRGDTRQGYLQEVLARGRGRGGRGRELLHPQLHSPRVTALTAMPKQELISPPPPISAVN